MLVKMMVNWSGPTFNLPIGSVAEVDAATARDLIDQGKAESHEEFAALNGQAYVKAEPIVVQNSVPDPIAAVGTVPDSFAPPVTTSDAPAGTRPKAPRKSTEPQVSGPLVPARPDGTAGVVPQAPAEVK